MSDFQAFGRIIIVLGVVLIIVGLLIVLGGRFIPWLGRLPGGYSPSRPKFLLLFSPC